MHFLILRKVNLAAGFACLLALSLFCLGSIASGQSTDIALPAAVRTNEVLGTIAARDIGDSRLTDHFYEFTGLPGDLLITVESRNFNGDVDVFTAAGLRPLLKLTVYSGSSSPVTKSIYLRKREDLILRVEGRSPNDDEATYRLYFGGSFEPIPGERFLAENGNAATEPALTGAKSGKKGRRVSSVGARIEEPPSEEVAAAPTPQPSPAESPQPDEAKAEALKTEATRTEATKTEATRTPARTPRGRRLAGRRTPTPPKEKPAKTETENTARTENSEAETKPAPTPKRPARKSSTARSVATAPVVQEPETGPRLVIETSDGTMINRYMSSVRRVVVENGQVVVAGKDGKVERIPLANIVKMSISP